MAKKIVLDDKQATKLEAAAKAIGITTAAALDKAISELKAESIWHVAARAGVSNTGSPVINSSLRALRAMQAQEKATAKTAKAAKKSVFQLLGIKGINHA